VNMKDGIVKLLKKDNLSHGVNVIIDENNKITIDLHIIVSYGVSISAVADNLISNVKYNVEEFSGLEVEKINIFVEGVRVID
ncbi:MAG: Asp23/Gls24 family envelope stress response protein, partial [Clostridiales bacterium]|nr:Asp23/Gls24 family envelope stress response protein [Clostridiales bacterium]